MSGTKRATKEGASHLALALDHVVNVAKGPASYAPYCLFTPGWLVGYDGIVAAGCVVAENMPGIAPDTEIFRNAVKRAGIPFSINVHADHLIVRGDSVKVRVPIVPPDSVLTVMPDPPLMSVAPHGDELKQMLRVVGSITTTREQRVLGCSVLLKRNSCVATNGNTILEGHHGCELPGQWLLPREFVDVLSKVKFAPSHVGWSDTTFTVWFGPAAYLRTNTYAEAYPDTDIIFAQQISQVADMRPIPQATLVALDTLKPFVDGKVLLHAQGINTRQDGLGANYYFDHHMRGDRSVPYEALRYAATHGSYIGFNKDGFYWYGPKVRAITSAPAEVAYVPRDPATIAAELNGDIPF